MESLSGRLVIRRYGWEKTCAGASAGRARRDFRRRDDSEGYSSSVLRTKSARFVTPSFGRIETS